MPPLKKRKLSDASVDIEESISPDLDQEEEQPQLEQEIFSVNTNLKPFYIIDPKPPTTTNQSTFNSIFKKITNQTTDFSKLKTPFLPLFNGLESQENVKYRYELYTTIWQNQQDKIQQILDNANNELFNQLLKFIEQEVNDEKLDIGYIQLTSNNANNFRILNEFLTFMNFQKSKEYKIISINSKNGSNIRNLIKEIIKQFIDQVSDCNSDNYLNYDIEILKNWFNKKSNKDCKLVIVVEDTNLFNHQVLNQLIKILQSSIDEISIKLLLALNCETVSSWINNNLRNEIRLNLNGYKFKSNNNKSLGYIILNNLFLTPELDNSNPLLIEKKLSIILLNRYENSNNSIDSLISIIKLCYMIYFYSSPLSILISKFDKSPIYLDGLRKLPSFKNHIELKAKQKDPIVKDLITSDTKLIHLFNQSKNQYQKHKLSIMNSINIVYNIDPFKSKEKFQLYQLLINNKLLNSKYFHEVINISNYSPTQLIKLVNEIFTNTTEKIGDIKDKYLIELKNEINKLTITTTTTIDKTVLNTCIEEYFKNPILITPLNYMIFNEIFSMNGGIIKNKYLLQENYNNLALNLLRPNLRQTIEQSLDNFEIYLNNPLINKTTLPNTDSITSNIKTPLLCLLFKLYKEAPASINLNDFYQAFASQLNKPTTIKSEEEWSKINYSWFIENCYELMHLGIVQFKRVNEHLEKAIWKGV
ncbi:ORC3 [Candida jiufengensis]|uniref:ORC3 n=1 Tax=Candida jiufengensis TaxID=497108 RepID=UPI002224FFE9|nr:ORC3 [Candida jiufengensis]KAI5953133.1 ORC3 [Candida jiufengensis]